MICRKILKSYESIPNIFFVEHHATLIISVSLLLFAFSGSAAIYDSVDNTIMISDANEDLVLHLDLDKKCLIDTVFVRGRKVVLSETGVVSAIKKDGEWFRVLFYYYRFYAVHKSILYSFQNASHLFDLT